MTFAAAAALLLVACGGGHAGEEPGLATLESDEQVTEELPASSAEDVDAEEALLEFAGCMRDAGFTDFPDPQVDADGRIGFGFRGLQESEIDPQSDDFRAAIESCGESLEGVAFGPGAEGGGFEDPEFKIRWSNSPGA